MCKKCYPEVNPKQSFPDMETKIQKFWETNKTFQKSVDERPETNIFNFYDWPPFATGTPHYGHLLAWTLKDVIPRYQTMLWKKVDRRFGWDCHGLPIENIVEKKLEISWKSDIEQKVWVYEFNEACRANVLTYTDEWKKVVNRMWRWVDMDHPYKTMDTDFMESVWWVFKSIYDKGLIYEGNRVVPYCTRCCTPLSNFEVNQGYKDKQDKTATVKFKVKGTENKYILAWTTTPWTLPANIWLAVWAEITYVELLDKENSETYVLAKDRIASYYKNEEDYAIVREYKWSCLSWIEYEPVVNDFAVQLWDMAKDMWINFKMWKNAYKVVIWHHVTTESGTWVVHIAPAFWEDDNIIGKEHDLWIINHIDDEWMTYWLLDDSHNWVKVFDFNEIVLKHLKETNALVVISSVNHSYPHCWRCDTPLIYRAISAWYVNVEAIKDKMVVNNQKINWVPDIIKNWRFGKWVENARDWNISRNRYWGSAIPVWQSEDKKEEICIGSIKELYELNKDFGQITEKDWKYFYADTMQEVDIHKHFVDNILIKHPVSWATLKRIPEVLDCWFESWAMPYASKHYPFENETFKFPAEYIAEWLDQTRGWFYTLLILGTALFDNTPFLNVVVNWIVLAEDGRKMSKSLKNYPDPSLIFDTYWADAMRFYLMNSPVVEAQDLRFSEAWVEEVVKKVILPLWNTYSFFTTYANIDNFESNSWNIYYVRHGETDNNKNWILNGWDDDQGLNSEWIEATHKLWEYIKTSNIIKFDKIIVSPMLRTKETCDIIKSYLDYDVEVEVVEGLREQMFGEFAWMNHDEIKSKYNLANDRELRITYRNNKLENQEQFTSKVVKTYKEIEEKYEWLNVLVVAHGWTFRAINSYLNDLDQNTAFLDMPVVGNSQLYKLPNYKKVNPLDKWIISELNKLILDVSTGLDNYRLNEACKPIVKFMDNLTNWYIRRSRKRFWWSEMTPDKLSAYNTLYEVLVEVSKVIAPFMPFVSEEIFKNLTWKESVHLELFPKAITSFIIPELNESMKETQEIITLWLACRANSKIRVRQPLSYAKITHNMSDYYKEILKEELNVKDILIFDEAELPKKICKPNARLIGPKFGQNVKFIISEAKAWNFIELNDGNVQVWEFVLEMWEFEIEFISAETNSNPNEVIESWNWIVVALNTEITESLKTEWYARDIVRQIQESRKEAWYNVDDRIKINLVWAENIVSTFWDYITHETLSQFDSFENADLVKEIEIEDLKITLKLKK